MRRALISVHNKEGIIPFAQGLLKLGFEIVATSGTLKYLVEAGIPCVDISSLMGMPYILSGRLRTLHSKIHGGLLVDRDKMEHNTQARNLGLILIDLVAINFDTFSQEVDFETLIDNIDTGGPALLRSAARNYRYVLVVSSPNQYSLVIERLESDTADEDFRAHMAAIAFSSTARYDAMIASRMTATLDTKEPFPSILPGHYTREGYLEYGENKHQNGAFYKNLIASQSSMNAMVNLSSNKLNAKNYMNADIAWECVNIFKKSSVAVVNNQNPIAVSVNNSLIDAFSYVYNCDKRALDGAFIAFNQALTKDIATLLYEANNSFAGIMATSYDDGVKELLESHPVYGKKLIVLEVPKNSLYKKSHHNIRAITGGLLLQEADVIEDNIKAWRIATRVHPKEQQLVDMAFALAVASIAKSYSAVVVKNRVTLGISAGQSSDFDAVSIALSKSGTLTKGSVLALDYPCSSLDVIQLAHEVGVKAIIQPGDVSKNTSEIVRVANDLEISVIFAKNCHCRY